VTRAEVDNIASVAATTAWGLFAAVWIGGAVYNSRHAPPVARRAQKRAVWLVVALATWAVVDAVPNRAWDALTLDARWPRALGFALLASATAFTIWARIALGRMWSSAVILRQDHELRTNGPYAITRHPIYTGIMAMLIGTALLAGGGRMIVVVAVGVLYVLAKIRDEERFLTDLFPRDYERYRAAVPMLVPRPRWTHARRH
jgi:protein-S-isoprenylcysteine O-methyltransferase Ste14